MARKNEQTNSHAFSFTMLALAAGVFSCVLMVPMAQAATMAPGTVIDLANRDRARLGLMPLAENAQLASAAKEKAKDMIKNDYFAHTSPAGLDPWHWIRTAGYVYKAAGENLAINYDDAKEQEGAWMKSETHRANILNAKYTETGVAVVEGKIDGETSVVTVQMFGMPTVAVAHRTEPASPIPDPLPAIKGVETEKTLLEAIPEAPAAAPLVSELLPDAPVAVQTTKSSSQAVWLEGAWYVAVALLIASVFLAPMMLVMKSISALLGRFWEEQLLRAAYQAAAMAAVLEAHTRPIDLQHSG